LICLRGGGGGPPKGIFPALASNGSELRYLDPESVRLESPSEDNLLLPSLAFLEEDRRRSVVEELLALLESSKITFSELLNLFGSRTAPSISVIWAMVRAS
jgi:hypothetical protein